MAGSFSQELEDLLNPLPKFADPEDEDEVTKAKVIEGFDEDDGDNEISLSSLRKSNRSLLSETDKRYVGKAVSRKQLLMDIEASADEDDEDDDDDDDEDDDGEDTEGSMEEEIEGNSVEDEEGDDDDDDDDDDDGDDDDDDDIDIDTERKSTGSDALRGGKPVSKTKAADLIVPQGVDFHKLTEGMDDLGVSTDEDENSEESQGSDEEDGSDDEEMEDNDYDYEEEAKGGVRTFSKEKVDEEVEKGKAVKNQLALWDQLIEGRIKIHKALVVANQLPQPHTLPEFKRMGGAELAGQLKNSHKALKALQRSLLELHDQLLYQNTDTRSIALGKMDPQGDDEEINSDENEDEEMPVLKGEAPKRKLEMAEYPDLMAKRFAAFQPYQNATLQKWHDKTRLTMGKTSKGFGAFDRNILTQVEQVLMDRERLVRRTQTRRSEYRILGKKEAPPLVSENICSEVQEAEQQLKANTHLKDLDEDVFDDDDFYHQLLRELIERKTSAVDPNDQVAMGKQWLAIQKLRSKIKKKVDTKASKGRKVRFHIHSKLANFMAPVNHSSMSDEAVSELYRGLFGQKSTARE